MDEVSPKGGQNETVDLGPSCPNCGEHSTIVRMRDTEELHCVRCGGSMLKPV